MASIFLISTPLPLASLRSTRNTERPSERFLHLVGRRGAGEQQHQVGLQHAAGPDLLAVDDVAVVALLVGARLELGGVGAGGRLGDAEGLQAQRARGDARQILLLLGGIAVPEHRAHGVHLGVAGRRVAARLVHGLEDRAARRQRQAGAAVLLGDQRAEIAGLGQRLDELGRVGAVVIELHPVGIGKLIADVPHALADLAPAGIEGDGDGFSSVAHVMQVPEGVMRCRGDAVGRDDNRRLQWRLGDTLSPSLHGWARTVVIKPSVVRGSIQ